VSFVKFFAYKSAIYRLHYPKIYTTLCLSPRWRCSPQEIPGGFGRRAFWGRREIEMTAYESDELHLAEEDLDIAATIRDSFDRWAESQLRHVPALNKNRELVGEMIVSMRDAFSDTVGCIITLAKEAGAVETRPEYRSKSLRENGDVAHRSAAE
jgi:hypothetical protein